MKPRTDFKKCANTTSGTNSSDSWTSNLGKKFEQCTLACTILTDDANDIALFYLEVDVA